MTTNIEALEKARRFAARRFAALRENEYRHCHRSHAVAAALLEAQERYSLETYGVEGDCAGNGNGHVDLQYLNTGDSYASTICYYKGRFIVSSWGDIVEGSIS